MHGGLYRGVDSGHVRNCFLVNPMHLMPLQVTIAVLQYDICMHHPHRLYTIVYHCLMHHLHVLIRDTRRLSRCTTYSLIHNVFI